MKHVSVRHPCNGIYSLIFLPHRKHPVSIRNNNAVYTNTGYLTEDNAKQVNCGQNAAENIGLAYI
jgi:hypothetical protein